MARMMNLGKPINLIDVPRVELERQVQSQTLDVRIVRQAKLFCWRPIDEVGNHAIGRPAALRVVRIHHVTKPSLTANRGSAASIQHIAARHATQAKRQLWPTRRRSPDGSSSAGAAITCNGRDRPLPAKSRSDRYINRLCLRHEEAIGLLR